MPYASQTLLERGVRTQIMACHALSSLAESEIYAGQRVRAAQTIATIRKVLPGVNQPTSDIPAWELREFAEELDSGLWKIEHVIMREHL